MESLVLLVEDDLEVGVRLADALCHAGFCLSLSRSGQEALRQLGKGPRPDAIVIDAALDDIPGYELAHMVQHVPSLGAVPLVLLCSTFELAELKRCQKAGADAYLPREMPPEDIVRGILVALDEVLLRPPLKPAAVESAYVRAALALARAVDARDPRTFQHSERVTQLAVAVGRRIGLSAEVQEELRMGALLHDVGKIGIGDDLLACRGPLTYTQRRIIQAHAILGYTIVEPVGFPPGVKGIVRHHHEDFDGGGYPDGLAGHAISLGARIVRVADSFEAMTSDRIYRAARSKDEAAAELQACAAHEFDPEVVAYLLQVLAAEKEPPEPGPADDAAGDRTLASGLRLCPSSPAC